MSQVAVVVQGAQLTISDDATVRTDKGSVLGSGLKDYIRDNPRGWVEFGTTVELDTGEAWESDEHKGTAWVQNLWVGCVVEVEG